MRALFVRAVSRWCFGLQALAALLALSGRRAAADTVELVSGEVLKGVVRSIVDGKMSLDVAKPAPPVVEDKLFSAILKDVPKTAPKPVPKREELRSIAMIDVVQIKLDPVFDRSHATPPLIDNDPAKNGRPVSGTIKLRAGYHRFVLAYWHRNGGAFVRLAESRVEKTSDDRQRFVRGDMLAHLDSGATESSSPGFDKDGYRLPEKITGKLSNHVRYSVRRPSDGRPFEKMADVLTANFSVDHGTLDRISTRPFPNESDNLAIVFSGYLHVKEDGVYKFVLASDGGSQLYVGQTPTGLHSVDAPPLAPPWILTLADGSTLRGAIESWTESEIRLRMTIGRSSLAATVPATRIRKIWSGQAQGKTNSEKEGKIDRANVPADKDLVFARSASGALQRVPGRVQGMQGDSLVLQFNGKNRKIGLSKVAGVLPAAEENAGEGDATFHQVIETYGGNNIPCQLILLGSDMTKLRTLWGETLSVKTEDLTGMAVKNGKAISLAELKPAHVSQVPFFDRVIRYRVNQSLSGGPILLRDGKHSRGISVHAKTVLRYAIGGRFQRFRAKLGFQIPEGELGDASVRVLGDDKTLFAKPNLRGDGPIEPIDLDVTGVDTLTLAVDFGRNEDIGDRVVWADPTLIRTQIGPVGTGAPRDQPGK